MSNNVILQIDGVLGDADPTYEDVNGRLPYLHVG